MNAKILMCLGVGITLVSMDLQAAKIMVRPPALIPQPVSLKVAKGSPFILSLRTRFRLVGAVPGQDLRAAVRSVRALTGLELNPSPAWRFRRADVIILKLDPTVGAGRPAWQAAESYTLDVSKNGKRITIAASAGHGLFNGIQTLVQLADKGHDGVWRIPWVRIEDYPRFQWRGYLLDTVRHFRTKKELFRYIDLLALQKMDVLHLHLTDDQGWRVEIKCYPKLTEVGAALPDYSGHRGTNWFYTQSDIKELVSYAAERYVTIVPEIDMPGHCTAATTAYPELSCNGKPSTSLCVAKESTYEFMTNVLTEVDALFPSRFIHIGADEVWPKPWRTCPVCERKMAELASNGLPANVVRVRVPNVTRAGLPYQEDISLLEGYFVRRIDRFLTSQGKRMIGWDEILEGGLDSQSHAAVMAWRNKSAIAAALNEHREVVSSVYPQQYLDNNTSLADTYAVEPVPAGASPTEARLVLGVQGNMWGESTPTQASVDKRTFPRLCALAEVGWSPRKERNFASFAMRLNRFAKCLRRFGVVIAPVAVPGQQGRGSAAASRSSATFQKNTHTASLLKTQHDKH